MGAGRPPMYNSVEDMQEVIDKYFNSCKTYAKDKAGEIVTDSNGEPVKYTIKPITVTGLALALGLSSRQSLLNYQGRQEFMDAITRAKFQCEDYAVTRLYDKDGVQGGKFTLTNNFGWVEKTENVNNNTNMNMDIRSPFEQKATDYEKDLMAQGKLTGEQIQEILKR